MAKGKKYPNWKEKVHEWETSGKSANVWCKENQIPATTLVGWKKRLNHSSKNQRLESKKPFIELKDSSLSNSGIVLECHGVKIHIEQGFNNTVLKQCLVCLGGVAC